jgi:hypothetical protein
MQGEAPMLKVIAMIKIYLAGIPVMPVPAASR